MTGRGRCHPLHRPLIAAERQLTYDSRPELAQVPGWTVVDSLMTAQNRSAVQGQPAGRELQCLPVLRRNN